MRSSLYLRCAIVATLGLAGCGGGNECGEGTMAMDGRCVAEVTCGAGTVLMDGECIPTDLLECGDGTTTSDGTCVPSSDACADGTSFDMATRTCVPNTTIECGPGTRLAADGSCEVDPDAVCAEGTSFDTTAGLCTPDVVCRADQVPLDGFCVSQAELDASMADVSETSPDENDPAFGGTPEALTLTAVGSSSIFTGVIDAPSDLDADGAPDQDVDAWTFTGAAGDVVQISLRNIGDLQLGFQVTGPSGFARTSPLFVEAEPSRFLYLPYDGDYTITVAPQTTLAGVDGGPAGSASEQYVGSLSNVGPITPAALAPDTPTSGTFPDLRDNLYTISGPSGEAREVTVDMIGADVRPVYIVLDGSGAFVAELTDLTTSPLSRVYSADDDLQVLVDYTSLIGLENDYQITSVARTVTDLGALSPTTPTTSSPTAVDGGDTALFRVTPVADSVVLVELTSGANESITISDASGATIGSGTAPVRFYAETADPVLIAVSNTGTASETYELSITTFPLTDLGTYDRSTMTDGGARVGDLAGDATVYFRATTTEALLLQASTEQTSTRDLDIYVYDRSFTRLGAGTTAGDDVVRVDVPGAQLVFVELHNFSSTIATAAGVDVLTGTREIEPNDAAATATPLAVPGVLTGAIVSGDTDFVRITLAAPLGATELLHVRVDSASVGDDWTCRLWDSSGTTMLLEQTPRDEGCVLFADGLAAGDYLVELSKAGTTTRNYSLVARVIPGVLEAEPNDTTASAVDVSVPVYGELPLNTDTDLLSFVVPAGLSALLVNATAVGTDSTGTMDIDLSGPSGALGGADVDGTVFVATPAAGTYTVTMTRTSTTADLDGWYRLDVVQRTGLTTVTETEVNDTSAVANPIGTSHIVTGDVTPSGTDEDFFSFTLSSAVPAGQELVLQLYRTGSNPSSALQVGLVESDGTTVISTDSTGDPRELRFPALAAGTYYVRVRATFSTTFDTDYAVVVTIE